MLLSSLWRATHPANWPAYSARSRRPSGGAYSPGRPASSLSKFWKQRLKPSDWAYSRKSSRAWAIWAGASAWDREKAFNTEGTEDTEESRDKELGSAFIPLRPTRPLR